MPKEPVLCLDTNVLLRALVEEKSEQTKAAIQVLELIKQGEYKAIIPGLVLAELSWVLTSVYKVGKEELIDTLNAIINIPNAKVRDDYHWVLANELFSRYKLKYVDAVLLSLIAMTEPLTVLISFDQELLKSSIKGLNVVSPVEFVNIDTYPLIVAKSQNTANNG